MSTPDLRAKSPKSRPEHPRACKCGGELTQRALLKRMYQCNACLRDRQRAYRQSLREDPDRDRPPPERPQPSMPVLRWLERPMV